jgi:hypothetical protein
MGCALSGLTDGVKTLTYRQRLSVCDLVSVTLSDFHEIPYSRLQNQLPRNRDFRENRFRYSQTLCRAVNKFVLPFFMLNDLCKTSHMKS